MCSGQIMYTIYRDGGARLVHDVIKMMLGHYLHLLIICALGARDGEPARQASVSLELALSHIRHVQWQNLWEVCEPSSAHRCHA